MTGLPLGLLLAAALAGSARADADPFLTDSAAIADYVKAHAEPLDWKSVFAGPERVIYFGERHTDVRPKRKLVLHLKDAADAGVTVFAFEMLGEDRHGLIERFSRHEATEAEVAAAFASDWGPEGRGFMPAEYAHVLAAARDAGLTLEPLDLSIAAKESAWDECAKANPDSVCFDAELHARDNHMESRLEALAAGKGRVLAWTGAWHACALEGAAKLAQKGVSTRSYYLITRGNSYEKDTRIAFYLDAVEKFGWLPRDMMIPTRGVQACFGGLLSLPDPDVAPARRA